MQALARTREPSRWRITDRSSFTVSTARDAGEIDEALRLRYKVFTREQGARLAHLDAREQDRFDRYADHVIVRDRATRSVVACVRLLNREAARRSGGFASETEFDLATILAMPGGFLELGRTCVHPAYRDGAAITALWSGLARQLEQATAINVFGCASIDLSRGIAPVRALAGHLLARHGSPSDCRAIPRRPLPNMQAPAAAVATPTLLKAVLRLGGQVCGEPCWDPAFRTADLFVLLNTAWMDRRYARHFLRSSTAA